MIQLHIEEPLVLRLFEVINIGFARIRVQNQMIPLHIKERLVLRLFEVIKSK